MLSNQIEYPRFGQSTAWRVSLLSVRIHGGVAALKLNRRGFGGFPMKFTPRHVDSGNEYYPCVSIPGQTISRNACAGRPNQLLIFRPNQR